MINCSIATTKVTANDVWSLDEMLECFNAEIERADKVTSSAIDSQKALSALINKQQVRDFTLGLTGVDKFRFNALQGELSSGWLTAVPDFDHRLTSAEFETCIRLRLGCDLYKDQSMEDHLTERDASRQKNERQLRP